MSEESGLMGFIVGLIAGVIVMTLVCMYLALPASKENYTKQGWFEVNNKIYKVEFYDGLEKPKGETK